MDKKARERPVCSWELQQERDPVSRTVFEQERVIARAKEPNPMMDPVEIGGHGNWNIFTHGIFLRHSLHRHPYILGCA